MDKSNQLLIEINRTDLVLAPISMFNPNCYGVHMKIEFSQKYVELTGKLLGKTVLQASLHVIAD